MNQNEEKANAEVLRFLFDVAEPQLQKLLRERGASKLSDLSRDEANDLVVAALATTAFTKFPEANVAALTHGLRSFNHPSFGSSFRKVRALARQRVDPFEPTTGIDAAIFLAAMGLPVAPFDRKKPRILAEPSADIDVVIANFSRWQTAFVGYSPCDVPFYILLTDSLQTLKERLPHHPKLGDVRTLFKRTNQAIPGRATERFEHGTALFAREVGDKVETVAVLDDNPNQGSIALYAGWNENDSRVGAPNDGFVPVPAPFLQTVANEPAMAMWIHHPVGGRAYLN